MRAILLTVSAGVMLLAGCGSNADDAAAPAPEPAASTDAGSSSPAPPPEVGEAAPAVREFVVADAAEPAKSALWTLDKAKSRIAFTGAQTGREFTGSFSKFDIVIAFDPANLSSAHINATIDMASAATGDKQRDDALPASDWFSVKDYPSAVFEASDIRAAGAGYEARGKLTIRGVTRDLTLPFSLTISANRAIADGEVSLVRTDFGVGQGEFSTGEWVGLNVKVALHIEAAR